MNKAKLLATMVCVPTVIATVAPLVSCNKNNTTHADVDPTRKSAKTNADGLTFYPVNLSSAWDASNKLTATATVTTEAPAYQITVDSVNPIEGEQVAYVVTRMTPGVGRVVKAGDKVDFELEVTCSDSSTNSTLWSNKIQGLSSVWGETEDDIDDDYDGLSAAIDLDDNDSEYLGGIYSSGVQMNFQFHMDYRDIFKVALGLDGQTKDKWNDNLAKLSVVLANHCSSKVPVALEKNRIFDCTQPEGLYKQFGCKDYQKIDFNSETFETDSYDTNVFEVAHRDMVNPYDKSKKFKIIFLSARGTKTTDEWASNLDIGAYDEANPTNYLPEGKTLAEVHPEWHNQHNVKGYDIAVNRIWKKLFGTNGYCTRCGINMETDNVILFTTGYSRGGGIANILGARFVDEYVTQRPDAIYNITYCHASSFTTDKADYGHKYDSIHCVVNHDDFVGKVPFECWNLMKYGQIHTLKIGENEEMVKKYNQEWKRRDPTGAKEYVYYDFWLDNVETLPVQNRYDFYKPLEATETLSESYSSLEEAQEAVNENLQLYRDLNISDRYIKQEIKEESGEYVIHTTVALGAMSDIAINFFQGKLISISKLLSILPLFVSYEKYVGRLAFKIIVSTILGTPWSSVQKINHSSVTYYFAAANMPEDQK